MSKASAIFSYSAAKSVRSSPASSSRSDSSSKTRNKQTTSTVTESSPRKYRVQTEVKSSPVGARGANINVKSRLQISEMPGKANKDRWITNQSPRMDQTRPTEESQKEVKKQMSGSKVYAVSGLVQLQNSRSDNKTSARRGLFEDASDSSDAPSNVNVKTMRSCFERKENRVPSKPPPSPSPSRPKAQTSNIKNNSNNIKGILSSRSKFDNHSPSRFRAPMSNSNTPTPQPNKLRRSMSTGTLGISGDNFAHSNLLRSHSQHAMTPKHRVRFQDEVTPGCFSPVLLETQGSGESIVGETTNLTVAVRLRPPRQGECSVVTVEGKTVKVRALGTEHTFSYDYCFSSTGDHTRSQQELFDTMVQPLVDAAFQSYNVCLFAYGQTGSGKSYSMMGEEITSSNTITEKAGIIPRFSQQLFKIIRGSEEYSKTQIEISYFEIYYEKIHDLLGPVLENGRGAPLRVREHPELGPYVVDLAVRKVDSFKSLQDLLRVGNTNKATAATGMNVNSSRSHTIFTITLSQSQEDDRPSVCSKINLIDLAGSERLAHTCASGDRLKEGVSINRSLLTLGKVISSLAENKRGFIPYRESVLTWLLKESLGGNSQTAMLATISPSSQYVEETLSTLRYACQARNIVNTVRINERPEKKIRELMEEIQKLKDEFRSVDHVECEQKVQTLQEELKQTKHSLRKAKFVIARSEEEVEKLEKEWAKKEDINIHEECEKKIQALEKEISKNENHNKRLEREIIELRRECLEAKEDKFEHEIEIKHLVESLDDCNKSRSSQKEETCRLKIELEEFQNNNKQLKSKISKLENELEECRHKNSNYEADLCQMKSNMLEINKNFSHEHCEVQILMLQTALQEAERFSRQFQEKVKILERKFIDVTNTTNHEGCEKEISALKETIKEVKQSSNHGNCDRVIERLKISLSESEVAISELQNDVSKIKENNTLLETIKEQNEKEIFSLKSALSQLEKTASHDECEERVDTLKKALSVAKSMNTHVQCENRISELEMEIRNLQSVIPTDHSGCDEKINNLFYAVEKYADENNKLVKKHQEEISHYTEKITSLEEQISSLTVEIENKKSVRNNSQDFVYLESQLKILKDENSKLKKKKVEDENKIMLLDQQVISLTKQLLDVKSQLRGSVREKESSESLCSQLQEQLMQQDRKLALTQSSHQIEDDKENWETPSKVIRRSIAQYSKSKKNSRCSLVLKSEEIHQSLKDAEDICARLKIPWVFQLEPEVTTHSWFDTNVRVWDQRTMSSVRWPQDVFLGWLREMKDTILSKSGGKKIFESATWMQKIKDPEPLAAESGNNKTTTLQEEVANLQSRIVALRSLCNPKDKHQVLSAITSLGRAVTELSSQLGLSSPLKSSNANTNARRKL